jgi:hypothetical protein
LLILCVASASDDAAAFEDVEAPPSSPESLEATPSSRIKDWFDFILYSPQWLLTASNALKRVWKLVQSLGRDCLTTWYNLLGCVSIFGAGVYSYFEIKSFWSEKPSTHTHKKSSDTTNKNRAKPRNAKNRQPITVVESVFESVDEKKRDVQFDIPRDFIEADRIVKERNAKVQAGKNERQAKETQKEAETNERRAKETQKEAEKKAKGATWVAKQLTYLPFGMSVIQTFGVIGFIVAISNFHFLGGLCAIAATTVDLAFTAITGYDIFGMLVKIVQCKETLEYEFRRFINSTKIGLEYEFRSFINSTKIGLDTLKEIPKSPVALLVFLLLFVLLAYYAQARHDAESYANSLIMIGNTRREILTSEEHADSEEHTDTDEHTDTEEHVDIEAQPVETDDLSPQRCREILRSFIQEHY